MIYFGMKIITNHYVNTTIIARQGEVNDMNRPTVSKPPVRIGELPNRGSSVVREPMKLEIKVETNLDQVEAQLKRIEESLQRVDKQIERVNKLSVDDDPIPSRGTVRSSSRG
jgi:hypothetical protein